MFYPSLSGGYYNGYASVAANEARSAAREAQDDIEFIKHDIDRLLLVAEAMWELMKQKNGYTDEILTQVIGEIEKRKVVVDGVAVKDAPVTCPNCGKTNLAKRLFCIYCGATIASKPFAR
ncbi:MAG TPA: zinc ribbon domain-containing protein [Verrucomicrobiae bacterium]|nr:zinc ribbon domain-containing protein [Verrucomicrobiae bacterium]